MAVLPGMMTVSTEPPLTTHTRQWRHTLGVSLRGELNSVEGNIWVLFKRKELWRHWVPLRAIRKNKECSKRNPNGQPVLSETSLPPPPGLSGQRPQWSCRSGHA